MQGLVQRSGGRGDLSSAVTVRVRPPVRAAAVALLAAALLGACSKATGARPAAAPGGTATAASTASPEAAKALEASAKQVRSLVETLAAPMVAGALKKDVTVDDAGPCEIGTDNPWPQRWGYAVMVTLSSNKPRQSATTLQQQLQAQGWTIRPHDATADALDFDALRNGVVLRVAGEPNPSAVVIEGYGACIGANGVPAR
jgi:hypothetical protein